MKLAYAVGELHPRQVFRIARARRRAVINVFVRLEADGICGFGEASPNSFYDESAEGVTAKLDAAAPFLADLRLGNRNDLNRAWEQIWTRVAPSRAAQCALDLALWDWLARKEGITVSELAWGTKAAPVKSFSTIGLSTPEELEDKLRDLDGFPLVKLKSDQSADLEPLRRLRARSQAIVAIDANCAWGGLDLTAFSGSLRELKVEFIEQPLPPSDDAQLLALPDGPPIMADESCVTEADVDRLGPNFSGFNIKLVKCGGLTPGLRMVRRGQERGLKTMVGCMLESSALIAAGAVIAQHTDYADLDGAWLLSDDPFRGWPFDRGTLIPPLGPGLGAEPILPLFA